MAYLVWHIRKRAVYHQGFETAITERIKTVGSKQFLDCLILLATAQIVESHCLPPAASLIM
jgi:hypothetical protein